VDRAVDGIGLAKPSYGIQMYTVFLDTHGLLRWVVLLAAAWALLRAYSGWFSSRPWRGADRWAGLFFSGALDLQVALGIALAFVSPLVQDALFGFGAAMQEPHLRFFLVEHIPLVLVALVLVHVRARIVRSAEDDREKHRRVALLYTLATLAILVAIPWWRPLLPGLA
jgi:uncharacterized membrane protein YozB (DUF420 family)